FIILCFKHLLFWQLTKHFASAFETYNTLTFLHRYSFSYFHGCFREKLHLQNKITSNANLINL
ncbi:MAG: hypothetical protein ACOYLP_11315, partial [Flavobacterium sp.]|uniref:hypothetical protein n=1 Tax=Flavobacterium sp. TaxID=239 RepID=UPI003BC2B063